MEQCNSYELKPERIEKILSLLKMETEEIETIEINNFLNRKIEKEESFWGDGLIMPKAITFITGAGKIGKSMLAMNLALSLAAGKRYLEFNVPKPRKVLLLQQEISEYNLQQRLKTMSEKTKIPYGRFYCMTSHSKIDTAEGLLQIKKYIRKIKPDVVILDPMYKFFLTLDENLSKDIKVLLNEIDLLIEEFRIAVVVIHHHKKAGSNEKNGTHMIRGSSTLFDYGDAYLMLQKVKNKIIKIDFELRNAENPEPMFVKMNENLWFDMVSGIDI